MPIEIRPTSDVSVGATRIISVDLTDDLDLFPSPTLLTGTPMIVEVTTTDLTLASKAVSTAALSINGRTVAIGKAVQFTGAGFVDGVTYTIRVTVSTDSTPAEVIVYDLKVKGT